MGIHVGNGPISSPSGHSPKRPPTWAAQDKIRELQVWEWTVSCTTVEWYPLPFLAQRPTWLLRALEQHPDPIHPWAQLFRTLGDAAVLQGAKAAQETLDPTP